MSLPRYSEYKTSGVEWLGDVPEHWETWKLSHAFGSIGSGTTPPSNERQWYEDGVVPWVTTGELRENVIYETAKSVTAAALEKFTALRVHPAGSLAVAMYGATIGRLGFLGVDATTNQACCVLSSPVFLDTRFVYFWLDGFKQTIINLYATGGGQPNISQDTIASLRIPAPHIEEQQTIAAFLDCETGKIDALIAEQRRLVELLAEKRQAVISHAVTKGLNPNAPMKDSGIEWLGDVPAHWRLAKLKQLARFSGGGTPSRENLSYWNGDIPWVSPKDMKRMFIDSAEECITSEGLKNSTTNLLPSGRVLMVVRSGILQHTIPVAINLVPVTLNQDMKALCFRDDECINKFFLRWVQGLNDLLLLAWAKQGATVESIEHAYLAETVISLPDVEEQRVIIAFLDSEIAKFDTLTTESNRTIELLQERRKIPCAWHVLSAHERGRVGRTYRTTLQECR